MEMQFVPIDNFTGTGSTYDKEYRTFGIVAYKNYESMYHRDVKLSEHIQYFIEMGTGAHYYSQGAFSSAYRKAETTINLSDVQVDTKGRRVACISLGVMGANGSCDMGIESFDGKSWFSHFWCSSKRADSGDKITNATKVVITVIPSRDNNFDYVTGKFTWYDKNGAEIAVSQKSRELVCKESRNTIFGENDTALTTQRFYRFMSLIPRDELGYSPESDIADESYLIGNLTKNKLYPSNGSSVVWGTTLMDYIWSVQGWNILAFNPGNDDVISIKHREYLYYK